MRERKDERGAKQVRKKREMQLHQEKNPPKRPRQKNRAPQGHRRRSTDDHDEKNELTFSANR